MVEALSECLQAQLDEVHAIHYIFFPAAVISKAEIPDDLFADDLMLSDEYHNLLSAMTVRTRISLYTESASDSNAVQLKIGFRTSPYSADYSNNMNVPQSFVQVTFPRDYPEMPPSLVIIMNMSLSNTTQAHLMSKLNKVIRGIKDGVCIYNSAMFLNEFLNDVHARHYKLWDETTGEALDVDHREVPIEYSTTIAKNISSETNDTKPCSSEGTSIFTSKGLLSLIPQDEPICFDGINSILLPPLSHSSSVTNEASTVDKEMYSSTFDISQWSVQCVIQSPLWYETNKKTMDVNSTGQRHKDFVTYSHHSMVEEGFWQSYKSSHPLGNYTARSQTHRSGFKGLESPNDLTNSHISNVPMASVLHRSQSDASFGRLDSDTFYPLDADKVLAITRAKIVLETLASENVVERYKQDFNETMIFVENSYSSFVQAQHMLDKNFYMVWKYMLPAFCVLNTQEPNFNSKDDVHCFVIRRKFFMQRVISRVALLARLQHNSIARYYQCWVEKQNSSDMMSKLMRRADTLIEGLANCVEAKDDIDVDSPKYRMQCLLLDTNKREDDELTEFLLAEAVTHRKMYIQIEHCEGITLEDVIQHETLYKNEQRIWTFIRHLLDVLAYLHSNHAYHQALSLKNIIVHTDASVTGLKVCGFGITSLLRRLCHSGFFCEHGKCSCQHYYSEMRKELYSYHPSIFGVGSPIDFSDWHALQNVSNYDAQQEDMFAFGVLIFRMWHPPIDEQSFREMFSNIVSTHKFPQYFLQSTPPIIVSTLIRLLSADRRPTAMELLSETLVPPVMDRDLYRQYLRRLQNPSSEEAMDALGFLFKRGWKGDITRLRSNIPVRDISIISFVMGRLETFMRQRSVIIGPPLILQPNAPDEDNEDCVLAVNESNTVLYLTRKILNGMQKFYHITSQNEYMIMMKRFCVGEIFDGGKCELSAVYCSSQRLEGHICLSDISRHIKRSTGDNEFLSRADFSVVAMEAEALVTAVESLKSLDLCGSVSLVIHYPSFVIDFIALVFNVDVETAHKVYTSIGSVDINQYTLSKLLGELGVAEDGKDVMMKKVSDILRSRISLSHALYDMHDLVIAHSCNNQSVLAPIFEKFADDIVRIDSRDPIVMPNCSKGLNHKQQGEYLKKLRHILELTRILKAIEHHGNSFMECIPESRVVELCDGSIEFPYFTCYLSSDRQEELVLVGGSIVDESKVLHVYFEYLLHNMTIFKGRDFTIGDNSEDYGPESIDVVVTCQSSKLLPAACSISSRLIDAGLHCECRALPLIHTDHYNERLRQFCGVKVRVHLQSRSGSSFEQNSHITLADSVTSERLSDDDGGSLRDLDYHLGDSKQPQLRSVSKFELNSAIKRHDRFSALMDTDTQLEGDIHLRKSPAPNVVEYDDERVFTNVSFHVEPIRGTYKHPRKFDSGVALVRYVKSLLLREI